MTDRTGRQTLNSVDITASGVLTIDWDIVKQQGLASRTDREDASINSLEPVIYEIITHRLFQVMDEGLRTVVQFAADPVIHDAEEVGFYYYTASGDVATAAAGIVWHSVGTPTTVKYVIKHFLNNPKVGVYDEDYFFNNETLYGGTHPPDQLIFTPVYYKGELIAWVGALTHESETGAIDPGGMAPSAINRYSDGLLRTPPIKIVERGLPREDIISWMAMAVRDPRTVLLDQRAKMAGLFRGKKRLLELCDKYGADAVIGSLRKSIEDSEARMRQKLRTYPDGIYRSVFFQDRGRVGEYALFRIPFAVIKRGDRMIIDSHGASPQQPNSYNIAGSALKCFIFGPLCNYCHDVDWNSGIMAPVEVRPPSYRSVVNPDQHAALSCGVTQGVGVSEIVRRAFSLMQFDSPDRLEINAPWSCWQSGAVTGGLNQYGLPIAVASLEHAAMGTGAWSDNDGVDCAGGSFAPLANTGDCEAWEDDLPILNLDYRYDTDMVGYGKYQGGVSQVHVQMVWNVDEVEWCTWGFGDAFHITPGLYGGYACPCYQITFIENTDLLERAVRKEKLPDNWIEYTEQLGGNKLQLPAANRTRIGHRGDVRILHYGGGGGYGDVLDRDPQQVVDDIKNKIISGWCARNIYKVVYSGHSHQVDLMATEALREKERSMRKQRGVPWELFEDGRRGKSPAQSLLEWYGPWGDDSYEDELVHSRGVYEKMRLTDPSPQEVFMPGEMRRQIGEYLGLDLKSEIFFCWKCGHELGDAHENFKKYTLIAERLPSEIYPPWPGFAGRDDMCVIREFYCPGCSTMMENECVPPGHPILHDLEIDLEALRQRVGGGSPAGSVERVGADG